MGVKKQNSSYVRVCQIGIPVTPWEMEASGGEVVYSSCMYLTGE